MTKGRNWDLLRRRTAGSELPIPEQGRVIHSKFDSTCLVCGGPISRGDTIMWRKGVGSWHLVEDCG